MADVLNARFFSVLALLGFCVVFASCSSSSRVLYEAPGTARIGPSIALLPVVLETNINDPANCVDYCDFTKNRYRVALAASDYLSGVLHYEVVCLSYACANVAGSPWEQDDLEHRASQLAGLAAARESELGLPKEFAAFGRQLATEFGVDSLVLIHGKADYIKHSDMAHWMATLTVSMYRDLFRGNAADVAVDIYSAWTGEKLWSSTVELTQFGPFNSELAAQYGYADPYGPTLFEGLGAARQ